MKDVDGDGYYEELSEALVATTRRAIGLSTLINNQSTIECRDSKRTAQGTDHPGS